MGYILKVQNLAVSSNQEEKTILKNISFEVEKKSIKLLLGPNGSGKSTLAYALMGLPRFKIREGTIYFKDKDVTKFPPEERAKMGMIMTFQDPAYFDNIKVEDFLRVSAKSKVSHNELKESLSLVGLSAKFLKRSLSRELSAGERKRIELASAILAKPQLLILDEPDAGLDIIIYRELYDILDNIREETGASIILITHREEIAAIADSAALIYKGEIIFQGRVRETMKKYCQIVERRKVCRNS